MSAAPSVLAPRGVVGAAVLAGALAAAVTTAATTAADPVLLFRLSSALIGVLALCGVPVLLLVARGPGPLPAMRAGALGVMIFSGASNLLLAARGLAAPGTSSHLGAGDVLLLATVPFAVLTVVRTPLVGGDAVRLDRLLPVALGVGSAVALLIWRTVLLDRGPTPVGTIVVLTLVAVVTSIVTLLVAVAVIGRDRTGTLLMVGALLLLLGFTVGATSAAASGAGTTVLATVLQCTAWPLVWGCQVLLPASAGLLRPDEAAAAERRSTVVTVVAICVATVLVVAASGAGGRDVVGQVLLTCVGAGMVLHVAVYQRQHLGQVEHLLHLADHDPLTGAGNRRALSAALAATAAAGGRVGVVVLNVDGFSAVNDRFGDRGGDAVLVAVAAALAGVVPDGGVYRLGGDEFALVAPLDGPGTVATAARARAATASAAAEVPGMGQVRLASSCGVHSVPASVHGHAGPPMVPISLASTALQAARRSGGDRVTVWSEDLATDDRRRELVETRLRHALATGGVEVHLQPVVDVATGRAVGFEALSRWTDAELGPVSPVEFIAVAEATGLVVALGRQVMADALTALVTTGALERGLSVAVNASPVELRRECFVASVADALAVHGVPPDLLVVEVTKAIFVATDDPAVAALDELAAMGSAWPWTTSAPGTPPCPTSPACPSTS